MPNVKPGRRRWRCFLCDGKWRNANNPREARRAHYMEFHYNDSYPGPERK